MNLAADAASFLVRYRLAAPRPLHELGVAKGRAISMTGDAPAGPDLWSVAEVEVPGDDGGGDAGLDRLRGQRERSACDAVQLRVYRPSDQQDCAALVYFHGGGWSIGSLDGVDAVCRVLAEGSGCVIVSVDYRQAPENPYPAPVQDCWRALRWVAAGGLEGVDVNRIAVGGDSAGANLAAACVLLARDTGLVSVAAQLLIYPPTDAYDDSDSTRACADGPVLTSADVRWFWNLYVPASIDRRSTTISPKYAETLAGLPPTTVITAEYDPIRDDGEDFADRLTAAGVSVNRRRVSGVYHGFFPLVGLIEAADETADEVGHWLRKVLAKTCDSTPGGRVVDA